MSSACSIPSRLGQVASVGLFLHGAGVLISCASLVSDRSKVVKVDALRRVRDGTRRRHRQLDRQSALTRLARPDCSLTEYQAALEGLARAYGRVDHVLAAGEGYRPVGLAPYRARSPLIDSALSALAGSTLPPARFAAGPAIDSTAAYLGCRYVVDGAQFGHAVIARALVRSEVATVLPEGALSFWGARFLSPGEWRGLCHRLENVATRTEAAIATISARRLFELFKRCLAQAASEAGR